MKCKRETLAQKVKRLELAIANQDKVICCHMRDKETLKNIIKCVENNLQSSLGACSGAEDVDTSLLLEADL